MPSGKASSADRSLCSARFACLSAAIWAAGTGLALRLDDEWADMTILKLRDRTVEYNVTR